MRYRPQLNLPYSKADLEAILDDALRVLQTLGVACAEPGTIERLTAAPGVRWDGGRLKFDPSVVRENVESVRRSNAGAETEEPRFEALPPWCCLNYADPETGEVRPPTTEDAVRATRMMDARGCKDWPIPVVPRDVPPRQATLAAEYVALKHSRALGGFMPAMDATEIECLIEMNQAVGRKFFLVEQVGISPLRFNDHGLAAALRFAPRDDVRTILVGAMPAVGSTAPLPMRAAVVQTAAESLALSVTSARVGMGPGGFGVQLFPFDFQYATMTFGSPEELLCSLATVQLYEFLNNRPRRFGSFHSTARMCDPHAAAERAAGVLWQALLGARRFRGAGQLALDEVFSPQQAIIDDEILAHAARLVRGFDPLAASGDAVQDIADGLASGTFLDQPATAAGFREFSHFPKLFHHYNVGHWRSEGSPAVLAEAWRMAQEQIAACTFALPPDQLQALDRAYHKACKLIGE